MRAPMDVATEWATRQHGPETGWSREVHRAVQRQAIGIARRRYARHGDTRYACIANYRLRPIGQPHRMPSTWDTRNADRARIFQQAA